MSILEICHMHPFLYRRGINAPKEVVVIAALFISNKHIFTSPINLTLQTNGLTLAACFPPAAGRGARPQRRWQRRGAVSGRPAPLRCGRGEDRNQRSPRPRGPNAETSDCSVFSRHSKSVLLSPLQ